MAALYWVGESVTIHFRFRREAHTLSMGEVALVLGLAFASPEAHLFGQAVGTLLACAVIRRQSALKVTFNVAQLVIQSALAIAVFRSIARPGLFGPGEWVGILLAVWVAALVGEALINLVIRLAGTRLSLREVVEAFLGLITGATMVATTTLLGAVAITADRRAAWIAVSAPLLLFLAYRMYARERHEGARVDALYEASRLFNATPHLEDSLAAAADWAVERFEVSTAVVVVYDTESEPAVATGADRSAGRWRKQLTADDQIRLRAVAGTPRMVEGLALHGGWLHDGPLRVRVGMVMPIGNTEQPMGFLLVANPLSEVTRFGTRDLQLLSTASSLLATAVENGRLYRQIEQSLEEMTALRWQLEATVRSKDDLIASVSHELRTPLTAVLGLSEELRDKGSSFDPDETAELVAVIADQSSDLSHLIDDLLVAARLDNDSLVLLPEAIDPAHGVESVIAALRRSHYRSLDPTVIVAADCPPVLADPLRLRQIVRNLLVNAIQYGGSSVAVRVGCRDGVGTVAVVDNGEGVPTGLEERVFHSYERVGQQPSQPGSVGLGLAVSRRLARSMGGDLRYRRSRGETVFELTLPRAEASVVKI